MLPQGPGSSAQCSQKLAPSLWAGCVLEWCLQTVCEPGKKSMDSGSRGAFDIFKQPRTSKACAQGVPPSHHSLGSSSRPRLPPPPVCSLSLELQGSFVCSLSLGLQGPPCVLALPASPSHPSAAPGPLEVPPPPGRSGCVSNTEK